MPELLSEIHKKVLLCDGAMGTQLQAAGLEPGECGDGWNLAYPDRVLQIQQRYVEAGSDCLTTNTFRANRLALDAHGLGGKAVEINRRAVEIAREAFGTRPGFVLGDLGPFGGLLEPYGLTTAEEALEAFLEQAKALVQAGVDAVIIETMTALDELELAIRAAREADAPCVIASVAFDLSHDGTAVRTMMGVSPGQAIQLMQEAGVDVAGTNCGANVDIDWAVRILEQYRRESDLPLLAQPNAGRPTLSEGKAVYHSDADSMAASVPALVSAGARIVGACCGSTPEYIQRFRRVLDQLG